MTVAMTVTIDQLITAIASDEVLATEYYTVSAMNDFTKFLKGEMTVSQSAYL